MNRRPLLIVAGALLGILLLALLGLQVARRSRGVDLSAQFARARATRAAASTVTREALDPTPTPGLAAIKALLTSPAYDLRLATARSLSQREDIALEDRAWLLVDALQAEVDHPSTDAPPVRDSYLAPDQMLRLILVRTLSELGDAAQPTLQAALVDADGLARDHLLIALACLGDPAALPEVRDLILSSPDIVVRMDGARALGVAGDGEAIAVLEQALADPARVEAHDSLGAYTVYPVREQAALALETLGVPVVRQADGSFARGDE